MTPELWDGDVTEPHKTTADEQAEILARLIAEQIQEQPDGPLARRLRETNDRTTTVAAFAAFWERLPEDVKERARAESGRGKVGA